MPGNITDHTLQQFWAEVAGQQHAMAGAVIAASAAQAAALATACVRISLGQQPDQTGPEEGHGQAGRLLEIGTRLAQWCDRDAAAIAEFVALREAGEEQRGQQLLCDAPADIGRLSLEAAEIVQQFRPQVAEQVQDDLEMSLTLLASSAQAAMLLLDSNLRLWPDPVLLARYEPVIDELIARIGQLTPVKRIRQN